MILVGFKDKDKLNDLMASLYCFNLIKAIPSFYNCILFKECDLYSLLYSFIQLLKQTKDS